MSVDETLYFSVDDLYLCAAASSVHCIHEGLAIQQEAGTQHWFLGLAVVEGRLLPVTDLGAYYGRSPSSGRVIEVVHKLGSVGLRVDEISGVTSEPNREYQLIDITQLVQSEQFLDIQCVQDIQCELA